MNLLEALQGIERDETVEPHWRDRLRTMDFIRPDRQRKCGQALTGWGRCRLEELAAEAVPVTPTKEKTGRPRNADRSRNELIVAALCKYHGYEMFDGRGIVQTTEPASYTRLLELGVPNKAALTRFFTVRLRSRGSAYAAYQAKCMSGEIGAYLMVWKGEMPDRTPRLRDCDGATEDERID